MKKSIRTELTVAFLTILLLVFGGSVLINNVFLSKFYILETEGILKKAFNELDESMGGDELFTEDLEELSRLIERICSRDNINLVILNESFERKIWTFNGEVMAARLYAYINGLDGNKNGMFDSGEVKILKKTANYQIQWKVDSNMDQDYLEMWGTLKSGYYVMFRIPLEKLRENAKTSNEFTMYIALVVSIFALGIAWFLAKRITRPLLELTELSQNMAELDLSSRYTGSEKNEIGLLGTSFNKMSDALQDTFENLKNVNQQLSEANIQLQKDIEEKVRMEEMRKELLANVSHELKTPIALVQGYAEGLQECVADDEESRAFYCEVIIDEANKMNNLVRKILTLNELEYGQDKPNMEWFDLTAVVLSVIRKTDILIEQKEAVVFTEFPDEVMCYADAFKTEEIITNYLSNALNHLDYEREIRIRIVEEQGRWKLSVTNTGNPIPEEDLPLLWGKFFKVDKAHSREYGGSGIGLSIVKAIADSFGQSCGVVNHERAVEFWFTFASSEEG